MSGLMQSRTSAEFDASSRTALCEPSGVTDAGADTDVNQSIPLDRLELTTWNSENPRLAGGFLCMNIHVTAMAGDTVDFVLLGSDSENMAGSQPLLTLHLQASSGPGFYRCAVSADTIRQQFPELRFVALSSVKAGSSPSVSYTAWLSHIGKA